MILLAALLQGCPYRIWEPVSPEVQFPSFQIALDIPQGWHRFYDGTDDLLMSYDGLTLQNIRIRDVPLKGKRAEEEINDSHDMSPQDLAEWMVSTSSGDVQLKNRHPGIGFFHTCWK